MSKIKQQRFRANVKHIKIGKKISQILKFFKDDLKFRKIEYDVKIQVSLQYNQISIDDSRFGMILYNLISNSVRHTSEGVIKLSAKIIDFDKMLSRLEKYKENKPIAKPLDLEIDSEFSSYSMSSEKHISGNPSSIYLQVSITDTGSGMSEEVKRRCFNLFGNLKFKKEINQGNMGLGLASSYLICKSLKGNLLLLRSNLGEGSKFLFILPIQIVDQTRLPRNENI